MNQSGNQISVSEAIEQLSQACLREGMDGPVAITFSKFDIQRFSAEFAVKERFFIVNPDPEMRKITSIVTSSGPVKILEA